MAAADQETVLSAHRVALSKQVGRPLLKVCVSPNPCVLWACAEESPVTRARLRVDSMCWTLFEKKWGLLAVLGRSLMRCDLDAFRSCKNEE